MNDTIPCYPLIGIGFGPSNIALAIALREHGLDSLAHNALFIERQPEFAWHKSMMLDNTHMQISFLKALVTIRNPKSNFTFINYLHQKNRLNDFINLQTFFPSRQEFNDYLAWAASHFESQTHYDEHVFDIKPITEANCVVALEVYSRDSKGKERVNHTKNLVFGIGGGGYIPTQFKKFIHDQRIFHSSEYLTAMKDNTTAKRVAVIGAGQSAAEIFMNLHGRSSEHNIDFIIRANSIKPSDDSPFVNEIFNPDFTDQIFAKTELERQTFLKEYRQTNYACPDLPLIEEIYNVFYQQKVRQQQRHNLRVSTEIHAVNTDEQGIHLTLLNRQNGELKVCSYDAVILATGYVRDQHKEILAPLAKYLGDFSVDRHYRINTTAEFKPNIFLQGACESTHGLSDTLLSILAVRSQEIGHALQSAKSKNIATQDYALIE